jgi:hypothetical protein
MTEMKQYRDALPNVDRELLFLQYFQTNQPRYLDVLATMAESAAPGTRMESVSLNRHGDMALRASMRDASQVGDLRSKLIRSGLFSTVVVEEQTPTPDKQKVIVRMSGQWNPTAERKQAANERSGAGTASSANPQPRPHVAAPKTGITNAGPSAAATGTAMRAPAAQPGTNAEGANR